MQKGIHKRRFKLNIKERYLKRTDREFLMNSYRHIKIMNKMASKVDKDLRAIFTNEVKDLRSTVTYSYAQRFYNVTLFLGPHKNEQLFTHYPETSDIKVLKDELLKRISKGRAEARSRNTLKREFQGMRYDMSAPPVNYPKNTIMDNGILLDARTYQPVAIPSLPKIMPGFGGGAVFEKSGSIVELLKSEEYKQRIRRAKKPYDKANFVGVELEIVAKIDRTRLDAILIEAKLAGNVYVKTDGSIRTEKDTDIAHEVTLIAKERDIESIITRVCQVLNSKEVGGYVNNSCGLHVHLDMRSRDVNHCYKNLYAALPVLGGMVPPDRVDTDHGKRYCALTCADNFEGALREGVRYKALNAMSYQNHKTIEIRLHSGSINAMKINNWTKLLLSIINSKDTVVAGGIDAMKTTYNLSDDLVDYVKARTKKFEDRKLDTRKDHFEDSVA